MISESCKSGISKNLIKWYKENKRDLPWRETNNPYIIWISEIILQQTRVDQGLPYFFRFIERFPDIKSLAEAEEEEVLKLWQGLGYYSRARNLHFAAKEIYRKHNSIFPSNYENIRSLKGIGNYTAAAIASFAYKLPFAVVDGNVIRVITRLFGIETLVDTTIGCNLVNEIAQSLLPRKESDLYNQGIMELGALICTPNNPQCSVCPLAGFCIAYKTNSPQSFPVKSKIKRVSSRYFNYLFIKNQDKTYLQKRTSNDIWKNLYEFPLIETSEDIELSQLTASSLFKQLFRNAEVVINLDYKTKHILTHRRIFATFYKIEVISFDKNMVSKNHWIEISMDDISAYPVSRLMLKYLERVE